MTKFKAALIHLSMSIIVVSILALIIFYIWYPQPFAAIAHVIEPLKLLILVDVIIGPLLTFVVYKKYKKGLKFDLSVIALVQIAALVYGSYTIYQGRPSMLLIYNGKFHYMVEKFANNDDIKVAELKPGIFSPPKYGFINQLSNPGLYESYADIEAITDFELLIKPHALTADNMKAKFTKKTEQIDALLKKYPQDNIVFMPLDKDSVIYYVAISQARNKIIAQLRF